MIQAAKGSCSISCQSLGLLSDHSAKRSLSAPAQGIVEDVKQPNEYQLLGAVGEEKLSMQAEVW